MKVIGGKVAQLPVFKTRQARRQIAGGVVLLAVLLNCLLLPRRLAVVVQTVTLTQKPMTLTVRAPGWLEPKDSVTVRSQFEGPVVEKTFKEGQRVKKGQRLAVVGRDRIRLDYQTKKDGLRNAQSDLKRARTELKLQKTLFRKQAVAYSAVDDAARQLVRAEQALQAATESFAQETNRWNSAEVKAPIDGTIVRDGMGEDKFVGGGRDLVTVADVSMYKVRARVDELDIKKISEGQVGSVRLQIDPTRPLTAKVTQLGTRPEGAGSPEIPVVLEIVGPTRSDFRPRLTADVRIQVGVTEPTLAIPLSSVNNNDGEPKVYVVDAGRRLRMRSVRLGRTSADEVEVTRGLRRGDRVCTQVDPDFAAGMKVTLGKPGEPGADDRRSQTWLPPSEEEPVPGRGAPRKRRPW